MGLSSGLTYGAGFSKSILAPLLGFNPSTTNENKNVNTVYLERMH